MRRPIWSAATALLATVLLGATPWPAAGQEVRAVWLVRTGLVSPESVDQSVDDAARGGFNTLLVQVRGRGDAFYTSRLLPRSPLLAHTPQDFDPLTRLLTRARTRGLSVHAWINVLLVADFGQVLPPGHELLRHPEWVMVPRASAALALKQEGAALRQVVRAGARGGDAEGYYLNPAAPGVAEHLEAVVRELLQRYELDGLHLDFIRYPGPDYDWSRSALTAFRPALTTRELLTAPEREFAAWGDWRRAAVTRLVEGLSRAARAARPRCVVSAAVVPERVTALSQKMQDWPGWLAAGLLDAVCPMAYTTDDRVFVRQVELARGAAGASRGVWAGIGAYRLNAEGVVSKLRLARQAGAQGVVVFSHASLSGAALDCLRHAFETGGVKSAKGAPGAPTAVAP